MMLKLFKRAITMRHMAHPALSTKPRIKRAKSFNAGFQAFEVTWNGQTRHIEISSSNPCKILAGQIIGWRKNPDQGGWCSGAIWCG